MHCRLALSAALLGLFTRVTIAITCTTQNATPIESLIDSSAGGGGGGGGAGIFVSFDPFAVVSNAVKKRTTPNAKLANFAVAIVPRSADSAQCSGTESCFTIQGTPFCLDMTTGAFHDGVGTTGNALTGNYTLADGRSGNLYTGPYPQPTGTAAYSGVPTTAAGAGGAGQATAGTNASVTAAAAAGANSNGGAASTAMAATGPAGESAAATQSSAGQATATASATHNAAAVNKGTSVGAALGGLMGLLGALLL